MRDTSMVRRQRSSTDRLSDPLSGRDESWNGSSLALTSRVHTAQRDAAEGYRLTGGLPKE
ncbi:hypothetical protein PSPO01_00615 [Paraphaeosphaeria sporulosa]